MHITTPAILLSMQNPVREELVFFHWLPVQAAPTFRFHPHGLTEFREPWVRFHLGHIRKGPLLLILLLLQEFKEVLAVSEDLVYVGEWLLANSANIDIARKLRNSNA